MVVLNSTLPIPDVPVPIENLEVVSLNASSLNITWSQTADLQVCIDAYTRVEIVDYNGEVIFNETVTFEVTFLVVDQGLGMFRNSYSEIDFYEL